MEDRMRVSTLLIPAAVGSLIAATAWSADTERYRLEKSADGYVRMNIETGAMSLCQERDGQLVCKMAADERAAFQDEIDRLQEHVKKLDERVAKLESTPSARLESNLPTEEEFEKTMGYMERFLRGFMDIVKDMNKDEPSPQRT
jgi:flagellar motility protein MotE (MotC chaperone)